LHYALPQQDVLGVEHAFAYRGLRTLEDDLGYFPLYETVLIYRAELEQE
jgi:glycine betaine/choline ABC-type transport system substrate-binding protein